MPRVLDASVGGSFKWDTATEMRHRRATAKAKAKPKAKSLARTQPRGQKLLANSADSSRHGPPEAPASEATGNAEAEVYAQCIDFTQTNNNLCLFQQLNVFRKWWVPTEANKELGFIGRFVCSFALETAIAPGCRRNGAAPLHSMMRIIYINPLQTFGPNVLRVPAPCTFRRAS